MLDRRRGWRIAARFAAALLVLTLLATLAGQRALPDSLELDLDRAARLDPPLLDRAGRLLNPSIDGGWNLHQRVPIEHLPPLLPAAFVAAEDRRFWQHPGLDWRARTAALWQNLRAGRAVRGASTISEQVVRLLHPRPRTLWSRWVEGFEALRLELRFGKREILEFYLDQVPYGGNRRGVAQAARYYFGRDLDTLAQAEMLALAVLVRAPSRLARDPAALESRVRRLGAQLRLPPSALQLAPLARTPVQPQALHFAAEALRRARHGARTQAGAPLRTSLDSALQLRAEQLLAERLKDLARAGARQGAVLVLDLDGNRVRAWACADSEGTALAGTDSVLAPRQPGSTLKPLLYAMALERGWRADTRIDDKPLSAAVNHGLHDYRNYSRVHYGPVSVREALGNSLNIPAVRALQFVGGEAFLARLRALGMDSLAQHPTVYGDGLALGNGAVSLLELVQAYGALARGGVYRPLSLFADELEPRIERQVMQREAALQVGAILSDPQARRLEFGAGGVLRFPTRTAVKTGTSTDYRDAWTIAYDARHVVGVWIGNLSGRETDGVSGAVGPALLARALLAGLEHEPVPVAPSVTTAQPAAPEAEPLPPAPRLVQPVEGLQLALDPRIPAALESLQFELAWAEPLAEVWWRIDDGAPVRTRDGRYTWSLTRGAHRVSAEAVALSGRREVTAEVRFDVR